MLCVKTIALFLLQTVATMTLVNIRARVLFVYVIGAKMTLSGHGSFSGMGIRRNSQGE